MSQRARAAASGFHSPVWLLYRDAHGEEAPPLRLSHTFVDHSSAAELKANCKALVARMVSPQARVAQVYQVCPDGSRVVLSSSSGDGWFSSPTPWSEAVYARCFDADSAIAVLVREEFPFSTRTGVERACRLCPQAREE